MTDASFTVQLGGEGVTAEFSDERDEPQSLNAALVQSLCRAARTTLEGEGVRSGSVDILAVDTAVIADLNRQHMGHEGPTDVLSFPLDDPSEGDQFGFRPHVGDIVLCPAVAEAQASEHAGTLEAELHLLVIHAALHLVGHDHAVEDERVKMTERERVHLRTFGFDHPGVQK